MKNAWREADDDDRAFALEVVRRTREAWLPRAAMRDALNPDATLEPNRLSSASATPCRAVPGRTSWRAIAVALAVVVAVVAGEMWAVPAASTLDATRAHRIVGDVSVTLARVAEASLIGPVD